MRDSDWEILAELGKNPNVSRAAAALYMSQPTLTKRLQRIESELGICVANRGGRGLELTEEGRYVCERGAEHVRFVEDTRAHLAELKGLAVQSLRVGSSYSFNKYHLWDVLDGYEISTGNNVRFDVVNEQSDVLFRRVLDGELDVVFEQGEFSGPACRACVRKTPAYLVTAGKVALGDLPQMQRINYRSSGPSIALIDNWWASHFGGAAPEGTSVGYISFALDLVSRGEGFALCFLPDTFNNEHNLTMTPLTMPSGEPVVRSTWCVWPKGELSQPLQSFVTYITEEVALDEQTARR